MIFNEDCLEGMQKLGSGSVDLILTDLPYGILEYEKSRGLDLSALWQEFKRVLKQYKAAVLFASRRFTIELAASNLDWYKYKWVWVKNIACNFAHAKNAPMSKYEEILIFSDGAVNHKSCSKRRMPYNPQGLYKIPPHHFNGIAKHRLVYGRRPSDKADYVREVAGYPSDVLYFDAPPTNTRFHPNEKPVALLEYLIKTYSNEGETVLDATMGSGSTGVAAVNTGRNFIGFETETDFYNIAEKRINETLDKRGLFYWGTADTRIIPRP